MFELTNLDSIQIGMASAGADPASGATARLASPKPLTTAPSSPSATACSASASSDPPRTGSATAASISASSSRTRTRSATSAACRSPAPRCAASAWATFSWPRPVSHIWYFKGIPSRMGMLLDISPRTLEKVLYFANFIVLDPGDSNQTGLKKYELITDAKYREVEAKCGKGSFRAGMGAEAVKEMLQALDLDDISEKLKKEIAELAEKERDRETEGQKRARAVKRLEVVEAFRLSRQQARVDDSGRGAGHSAGPAPHGAAGRRPLCHQRPERPVPPRHQPQQPSEEAAGAGRAGHHRPQRKAHAAGSRGRADRQRPPRPPRDRPRQPGPEVPVRPAARQAGPFPSEPAGQARGLLRPFALSWSARS